MDFYQMEQILAIAECGSITEAAKKLFVSQPTVSYALSKAESELGARLFDRTSYPLKPTCAGEKYIETALHMRLLYSNLKSVCADASREAAGELHIGFPHNRSAQILPRIFTEFRSSYPNIQLCFHSYEAELMKKDLCHGELDMCILTKLEQYPELSYEHLYEEELRAVALDGVIDPAHLSSDGCSLRLPQALTELPLLLPSENSGLGKMLSLFIEYHHIRPEAPSRFAGNNALYMLAGAGLGVAILPQNVIDQSVQIPGLRSYALSEHGLGWIVCAMVHRDRILSAAERAFISLIRESFADYPRGMDIFPKFG